MPWTECSNETPFSTGTAGVTWNPNPDDYSFKMLIDDGDDQTIAFSLNIRSNQSSFSGGFPSKLFVELPAGYQAARAHGGPVVLNNTALPAGMYKLASGGTKLEISKADQSAFDSNNVGVRINAVLNVAAIA